MKQTTQETVGTLAGMIIGIAFCVRGMVDNGLAKNIPDALSVLQWQTVPWGFRIAVLAILIVCSGIGWAIAHELPTWRSRSN